MAIPSATKNKYSSCHTCGCSICCIGCNINPYKCGNSIHHYGNNISQFTLWLYHLPQSKISPIIQMWFSSSTNKQKWLFHLPQWQKNISHTTTTWQITSANSIQWLQTNCDNNICHIQHQKSWPNIFKNTIQWQTCQHLAKTIPTKIIIKNNIPHTPSKVGVMVRLTFSIHQMNPCQVEW